MEDEQLGVFLRTAAGSIVAGHVLGIGDRHMDNILLQRCSDVPGISGDCIKFLQIDFKHCFGNRTRIDANAIAIPAGMKDTLLKLNVFGPSSYDLSGSTISSLVSRIARLSGRAAAPPGSKWDELKALCGMAYRVLRRSNGIIIHMCRLLAYHHGFCWVAAERHLHHALHLEATEEDAVEKLCVRIETSSHSIAKAVKDFSHKFTNHATDDASKMSEQLSTRTVPPL